MSLANCLTVFLRYTMCCIHWYYYYYYYYYFILFFYFYYYYYWCRKVMFALQARADSQVGSRIAAYAEMNEYKLFVMFLWSFCFCASCCCCRMLMWMRRPNWTPSVWRVALSFHLALHYDTWRSALIRLLTISAAIASDLLCILLSQRLISFLNKNTFCGTQYLSHCCSLHGTVQLSRR